MRGRKRTPTALKLLRGNPGRRPLNTAEPDPGALEATCPGELVDAVARAEWDRAIVPAILTGHVTAGDRTLAIAHCELWATWLSQLAEAVKHPHVVAVGQHKYPRPNPARVLAHQSLQLLASIDEKLGFSPTSRSKVQVRGPASPIRTMLDQQRARFFHLDRG